MQKQKKGDGYYNLQKQHSTGSNGGSGGGGGGGSVIASGDRGVSGGNNFVVGGGIVNSEGYSYVNDVPSLQLHHRHSSGQKSSSASHRDHPQPNRTRRTQRRVTHNEKRYHSGQIDLF